MGVSLERVQFKFASIIGELCSEPIVMSQFAVWVDLKIAEYKAKGAMSLECSGDKPEPTWMKGVIPPAPATRLHKTDHNTTTPRKGIGVAGDITPAAVRSSPFSSSRSRPRPSEPQHNPDSPEVVVVKPEPSSPIPSPSAEAYPVTFHHNTATHTVSSQKRFSEDTAIDTGGHFNKHQRTSSSSSLKDPAHTATNQSLLSVIGEDSSHNPELRDTSLSADSSPHTAFALDHRWSVQEIASVNSSNTDYGLSQEESSNNDKWAEALGAHGNNSDILTQYYMEDHGDINSSTQNRPAGRLVCKMCDYNTPKAYNMRRHVLKHMPELRFKCPVCQKGFIDRYQLSLHAKKKHPDVMTLIQPNAEFDELADDTMIM